MSRLVTLLDYQGLGLAMILADTMGAAHSALGHRLHFYPAHPALVRSFDRSPRYVMLKKPGTYNARPGTTTSIQRLHKMRPCAVFEYRGDALLMEQASRLIG